MEWFYWLVPWEESILVVAAAGSAALFFPRGCASVRPSLHRKLCFWGGLSLAYLVSHTQLDYYSEHQFFIHRLQHLALHHLGPFLIVLSRPCPVLLAGMPSRMRRAFRLMAGWNSIRYPAQALCNPVVAVVLFSMLIGFWLLPSIHFMAMIDWRLYRLMNWSVFLSGLVFWGLVLTPGPVFAVKLSPGSRIGMMLAIIPPQIVIGAIIFFTAHELYPIYTICGRAIGGINALADQQIGGIILWIHGAMMSAVGILVVILRELMLAEYPEAGQKVA
ncbi:putative membrane protein [Nitrosospira multiformis ATCC 25196]|uniref:Membrane protein n=1 Tax=Nitrosospira multiformis (strain ATCC 25196 / NCIMB 11849 / C 71) TaxID=323848 RepID=Q2YBV8_NITMU|nr:cytochrome c oxidase assembly protein [Nitrosospira multiformis]ABB73763.1 putative membrane protein [Nitrosospira multiformis ATCC 25196]SEF41306.1 putative membrane protein [Nitrosospira multiformis ATCC 25196]